MTLTVGQIFFVVIIGSILLFAVISNGLVCYCVYKFRKLRNVTNVFICNLAVSDILLAGVLMPMRLHDISHTDEFHEGEFACKMINFAPVFCITSSIYTLVCVSFERRRAVVHSSEPQMQLKSLSRVLPGVWGFSLLVSLPTLIEYRVNEIITSDNGTASVLMTCGSEHMPGLYSVFNAGLVALISYILPVILMSKNYTQISMFIWKRGRQIHNADSASHMTANAQLFKARVKIVKLLVLVAVIFAVSWLPFFITLLYAKMTGTDASSNANGFVHMFLIAMATFSTAYNVFLYVIFNPNFNRAIRQVLRCAEPEENITASDQKRSDGVPSVSGQGASNTSAIGKQQISA